MKILGSRRPPPAMRRNLSFPPSATPPPAPSGQPRSRCSTPERTLRRALVPPCAQGPAAVAASSRPVEPPSRDTIVKVPCGKAFYERIPWDRLPPILQRYYIEIYKLEGQRLTLGQLSCAVRRILALVRHDDDAMARYARELLHAFIEDKGLWDTAEEVYRGG